MPSQATCQTSLVQPPRTSTLATSLPDQGVDQGRFAGADLAEDDDLDAAAGQLVVHLPQAGQLGPQAGFFFVGAVADAVERLLDGGQGLAVGVGRRQGG